MSLDWTQDILDFMRVGEQDTPATPVRLDDETWALRRRLIEEECTEALEALDEYSAYGGHPKTEAAVVKELADIIVVTIGCANAMGIDLRPIWNDVHKSNMDKFPDGKPIKDEGGKILKPPGWKKPDIAALIAAQKETTS